ncbi:MAG: TIGR01244 family phosphatase [Myxococcales bacterium]|nr:TIGR01244 family phosphatase [Myxococcales bacterium]
MNLSQLSERVFVCGQVQANEMSELASQGFATVICNRPDGEDPGQPSANEIQASVEAAGMKFFFVPFNPMNPDPHMVPKFAEAIEQANDGKILAYCRSGNRSSRLWAAVSQ